MACLQKKLPCKSVRFTCWNRAACVGGMFSKDLLPEVKRRCRALLTELSCTACFAIHEYDKAFYLLHVHRILGKRFQSKQCFCESCYSRLPKQFSSRIRETEMLYHILSDCGKWKCQRLGWAKIRTDLMDWNVTVSFSTAITNPQLC